MTNKKKLELVCNLLTDRSVGVLIKKAKLNEEEEMGAFLMVHYLNGQAGLILAEQVKA